MQHALLERRIALMGQAERLADPIHYYRMARLCAAPALVCEGVFVTRELNAAKLATERFT